MVIFFAAKFRAAIYIQRQRMVLSVSGDCKSFKKICFLKERDNYETCYSFRF